MITLKTTPENGAKVLALKTVKEVHWVGETLHDTLDKALTAINLFQGANSGLYKPVPIRLNGVHGIFMINEDGSLNFESRIIKADKGYRIEHLANVEEKLRELEMKYAPIIFSTLRQEGKHTINTRRMVKEIKLYENICKFIRKKNITYISK